MMNFGDRLCWVALALWVTAGCVDAPGGGDHHADHFHPPEHLVTHTQAATLDEVTGCSLAVVRTLDQQIIDEMNCIIPDSLVSFADLNVELGGSSTWAYLQPTARAAFERAIEARGSSFRVNSAYRTIAQQYLLYQWYQRGQCGISLAARPGLSNHQSGLAVDVSDYNGWRPFMESEGWDWLGGSDPVHFDYRGGGTRDIRNTAVEAFQRLWNRNNPGDLIDEDGLYGPQTEARLLRTPTNGFATGAVCDGSDPDPDPDPEPGGDDAVSVTVSGTTPTGPGASLFEAGTSRGVFDVVEGQRFSVSFVVRNGADRPVTDEVLVGYAFQSPYLAARSVSIDSDYPAADGRSWQPNDANDAPENQGPLSEEGLLNLVRFSSGESKRVTFEVEALATSVALPGNAFGRFWVKHVGGYYGEQDGWDDPVEVNRAGMLLRDSLPVDVFSPDHWRFEGPTSEDVEGWSLCGGRDADLSVDVEGDRLMAFASDGRVCVESPAWTRLDADAYPALRVVAAHDAGQHVLRVVWRGEGESWDMGRALAFPIPDGERPAELNLDMRQAQGWSGDIVGLRLQLVSDDLTEVGLALDAVEPLSEVPAMVVVADDDTDAPDPSDPAPQDNDPDPAVDDRPPRPEPGTGRPGDEPLSGAAPSRGQQAACAVRPGHGGAGGVFWIVLSLLIGLKSRARRRSGS